MDDTTSPDDQGTSPETGQEALSLAIILEQAQGARATAATKYKNQLDEVDEEVQRIKEAIEDLQRQLTSLVGFRDELAEQRVASEREHTQHAQDRIFELLESQATALRERSLTVAAGEVSRTSLITSRIKNSEMSSVLEDYTAGRDKLKDLEALPPSWRKSVLELHAQQGESLRTFVREVDPGPTQVDGPEIALDVIYTVNAPEGEPEVVSIVMPISEEVHTDWRARTEDIQLALAARVVQGVYEASHGIGLTRSHAAYGGHRGLLAVEMDIGIDHDRDLGELLSDAIGRALQDCRELRAANLKPRAIHVPVDYLLPPEAEEADDVE
jgi:hypothetical protein